MTNAKLQESIVDEDEMVYEQARREIGKYREDPDLHEVLFDINTEDGLARLEVFMVQLENIGVRCKKVDAVVKTSVFIGIEAARKLRLVDVREKIAGTE